MKILPLALLLMASLAFVLLGCSDNSAPIAGPVEKAAVQAAAPTDKVTPPDDPACWNRLKPMHFTGIETPIPEPPIKVDVMRVEDGKTIVRGLVLQAFWDADNPLVKGTLLITANLTLDNTSGEGPEWGTFVLTPDDKSVGGVWEVTWRGYRHKVGSSAWSAYIVDEGYGKGGKIEGMKLSAREVIHTTDLAGANPYTGDVNGTISHARFELERHFR